MSQQYHVVYKFIDGSSKSYTFPIDGPAGIPLVKRDTLAGLTDGTGWVNFKDPVTEQDIHINGNNVMEVTTSVFEEGNGPVVFDVEF